MTIENEIGRLKQLQTKKNNEQLNEEELKEYTKLLVIIILYLVNNLIKKEALAEIEGLEDLIAELEPPKPAPEPEPELTPPTTRKHKI